MPQGVFWTSAKHAYIVKKKANPTRTPRQFRVRARNITDDHDTTSNEVKHQLKRALHYLDTGEVVPESDGEDGNP